MLDDLDDVISIEVAAVEAGVDLATFLSWMCAAGTILVIPGSEDGRCGRKVVRGVAYHVPSCDCRFIPSPHPDITECK